MTQHAESALLASERLHRELIENASDLVTVMDPDGRVLYVSPSVTRLLGLQADTLVGKRVMDHVHPDDVAAVTDALARATAAPGVPVSVEYRFSDRNGGWHALESIGQASTRPLPVQRIVVNSRDVTVRRAAEATQRVLNDELAVARAAAEAATIAKSAFLATMSHEIRTPMNAVLGLTELVLGTELTAPQRRHLLMVRDAGDVLLTLLNDILDLSKIEAGHLEFEAVPLSIASVVHTALALLEPGAREHGLTTDAIIDPHLPAVVRGDPIRLRQVLTNLIGNAIKFTDEGSVTVEVGATAREGQTVSVRFTVRDTGIGIAEADRDRLFKDFSQVDASTTRRYGGTGLGLSISKQLVTGMGGVLEVESTVGQGSAFSFTLVFPVEAAAPPRHAESPVRLAGLRALVVDAAASERALVRGILAPLGAAVTEASTFIAALAALDTAEAEQRPFAVVLLDPHLTDDEGFGLATTIRARPGFATTRLLMLTSADRRTATMKRLPTGTAGFLLKPVSRSELVEATVDLVRGEVPAPSGRALRILVAEDDAINQEVASTMLEQRGHSVVVVGDGAAAVARVTTGHFDVVLMDLNMPVMDGITATTAIHALPGHATLPIVALTADASDAERERCLAAGMVDHLTKPFTAQAIIAVAERAAGRAPTPPSPMAVVPPPVPPSVRPRHSDTTHGPVALEAFRRTMRDAGVEDAVPHILDTFLASAPAHTEAVVEAMAGDDPERIRTEAHAFRSAASAIGAHALSATLLAIELAGRQRRITDARAHAATLAAASTAAIACVRDARAAVTGPTVPA